MHTYSSCMVLNSLVDVREDVARCRNWLVVYVLVFRSEPVDEPGFSLLHDYAIEPFLEALSPLCFTCRL